MKTPRPRARAPLDDDVLFIGPNTSDKSRRGGTAFRPGSIRRIVGGSALFFALLLALFAVLERSPSAAWFFGVIALGCLVFAIYPARTGRS
jgi:hypothetical protein